MNEKTIEMLKTRLAKNELRDDTDLACYIRLASRMASLGSTSAFEQIPIIVKRPEFAGRLDEILVECCKMELWDLGEQSGEDLALTIIEVQDFWVFYQRAKNTDLFPKEINHWFLSLEEKTELVDLDEDAVDVLERFLLTYPIATEERLAVVDAPITEFEARLLDKIARCIPVTIIKGVWSKPEPVARVSSGMKPTRNAASQVGLPVFACDDDKPPEALLRQYNRLSWQGETPAGRLRIQYQLLSSWKLLVEIEDSNGNPPLVVAMRIGFLGAVQDSKNPVRWIFNLKPFDRELQRKLLTLPLIVRMFDNFKINITSLKDFV